MKIAPQYRPTGYASFATFHPTFLYELIWNLAAAVALVAAERRFRLGRGKVFALYVALYSAGRFWIEALRIDSVNTIDGFRLNNYTALIAFLAASSVLVWLVRNRPGREETVESTVKGKTTVVYGAGLDEAPAAIGHPPSEHVDGGPSVTAAHPAADVSTNLQGTPARQLPPCSRNRP